MFAERREFLAALKERALNSEAELKVNTDQSITPESDTAMFSNLECEQRENRKKKQENIDSRFDICKADISEAGCSRDAPSERITEFFGSDIDDSDKDPDYELPESDDSNSIPLVSFENTIDPNQLNKNKKGRKSVKGDTRAMRKKRKMERNAEFWELGDYNKRVAYCSSLILRQEKKTMKLNSSKTRACSYQYHFKIAGELVEVCKQCFQKTFDLSNKFIENVITKTSFSGITTEDKRGSHIPANKINSDRIDMIKQHIGLIPTYKSHYCREKTGDRRFLPSFYTLTRMYDEYKAWIQPQSPVRHTRMECDSDHSIIEKKKKKYESRIEHPRDWYQLVRLCGKRYPFKVQEMTRNDFIDFASLLKSSLQVRKVDNDGNRFIWKDVKWIRYQKEFGLFSYKNSYKEDEPFKTMNFLRRGFSSPPLNLPKCKYPNPISSEKKSNLMDLLPYIDDVFHDFYKNLPTQTDVADYCSEEEEDILDDD
ncbi:unnamed protein product [Diabrotica balteata]|uniref:Uncharacterized protein n=1 Tax=Diabrotica balteata TaxID=107213 RepID=A0A9N9XD38_DIABA|nr:unnamed protein product [Diabrotica balteata]